MVLVVEPWIDIGIRLRFGVRRDCSVANAKPVCCQGLAPLWIRHKLSKLRDLAEKMATTPLSCHARAADALATSATSKSVGLTCSISRAVTRLVNRAQSEAA